ncbi:RNA pyrophosphohydrolase [Bacillus rhizoplanae]|uniref:RNA pyrophosphohydrolase n=1 Tax=Bacillus rhizoplanae TaxID=2880966 RepID=A0ABM8YBW3_9BACI|nr:NUDIX domain-containing protein [Bacillus rhizoplanae]CAG9613268.1 RNA pyrophosphohydrolase [Bacillus rhizoplanae]
MRDRSAAIIVEEGKLALIKRIWNEEVYYVFPSGGIEEGETPEEATIREVYEELGLHVKLQRPATTIKYNGTQYFHEAIIVGGTLGNGQGEEYVQNDRKRGEYIPIWVSVKDLLNINIKPLEVGKYVYELYEDS